MVVAIIVVSVVLFALFIVAAVAGNRAQTRMVDEEHARREARASDVEGDPLDS